MPHAFDQALTGAAALLLLLAALHDLATRTVPNWVACLLAAVGLGLRLIEGGALAGVALAASVFLGAGLFWLRGALGGADVKLGAAASLCLPPASVGPFLLAMSLAGGVLAVIYLALSCVVPRPAPGRPRNWLARVAKAEAWRMHRRGPLPYAVAIAAGGLHAFVPLIAG